MKFLIYIFLEYCLLLSVQSNTISPCCDLQNRLSCVNDLYVHFVQKISFSDQKVIQLIQGELWLKRPNLFHWHIVDPEECSIISNGKTIWFYIPLIKQVTAYYMENDNFKNIFLRLLSDDISICKDYTVIQKKDWFYLKSVCSNYLDLQEYKIHITKYGIMNSIIINKKNGQYVNYNFFKHSTKFIDVNKFNFIISKDIQFDDQRK